MADFEISARVKPEVSRRDKERVREELEEDISLTAQLEAGGSGGSRGGTDIDDLYSVLDDIDNKLGRLLDRITVAAGVRAESGRQAAGEDADITDQITSAIRGGFGLEGGGGVATMLEQTENEIDLKELQASFDGLAKALGVERDRGSESMRLGMADVESPGPLISAIQSVEEINTNILEEIRASEFDRDEIIDSVERGTDSIVSRIGDIGDLINNFAESNTGVLRDIRGAARGRRTSPEFDRDELKDTIEKGFNSLSDIITKHFSTLGNGQSKFFTQNIDLLTQIRDILRGAFGGGSGDGGGGGGGGDGGSGPFNQEAPTGGVDPPDEFNLATPEEETSALEDQLDEVIGSTQKLGDSNRGQTNILSTINGFLEDIEDFAAERNNILKLMAATGSLGGGGGGNGGGVLKGLGAFSLLNTLKGLGKRAGSLIKKALGNAFRKAKGLFNTITKKLKGAFKTGKNILSKGLKGPLKTGKILLANGLKSAVKTGRNILSKGLKSALKTGRNILSKGLKGALKTGKNILSKGLKGALKTGKNILSKGLTGALKTGKNLLKGVFGAGPALQVAIENEDKFRNTFNDVFNTNIEKLRRAQGDMFGEEDIKNARENKGAIDHIMDFFSGPSDKTFENIGGNPAKTPSDQRLFEEAERLRNENGKGADMTVNQNNSVEVKVDPKKVADDVADTVSREAEQAVSDFENEFQKRLNL